MEIDPTWAEAATLGPLLAQLPRPLWISVYDSANLGPHALVDALIKWLPPDIGVFFQDGVGVHAREARIARQYADVLSARLGKERVRIIAENRWRFSQCHHQRTGTTTGQVCRLPHLFV